MKTIWFIRHAESEANAGAATVDPGGIRLTELGNAQAKQIPKLFPTAPDLIVTSPYLRTKLTAQPLLATFPLVPHVEWQIHEFTYLAPERIGTSTYMDRIPIVQEYWTRADPHYIDGEGAESFGEFMRRVHTGLDLARTTPGNTIVVFAHGIVMYALLWVTLTGISEPDSDSMSNFRLFMNSFPIPNAAAIQFIHDGTRFLTSGVLTAHLTTGEKMTASS